MIENQSGLSPRGKAILLEDYNPEVKKGMIVIPQAVQENMMQVNQRARVIEVGPEAWSDEREPRARPGDLVLVSKFSGYIASGPADGKPYRLVNCNDVFAVITKEKENGGSGK